MDNQEIDRERRRQRRFEQMGTNEPICLTCGCTTWYNFEGHHIAGKRFDKEAVEYFCVLCHGDLTETQRYHPKSSSPLGKESTWERAVHFAYGLDDIIHAINKHLSHEPSKLSDRRIGLTYVRALSAFLRRASLRLRYHVIAVANENGKTRPRNTTRRKKH